MAQATNDQMQYSDDDDNGGSSSFGEQLDLQHYLRILRKHKWSIAFFTALVTVLAGYYAYTATPVYRATATMVLISDDRGPVGFEEFVGLDTSSQDYFQTQIEILKGPSLSRRVIDVLELWDHPELTGVSTTESSGTGGEAASGLAGLIASAKSAIGLERNSDSSDVDSESVADLNAEATSSQLPLGSNDEGAESFNSANLLNTAPELSTERKEIVQRFASRVSITPVRKTELIQISFEAEDPALAALIANTIGEEYIIRGVEDKLRESAQVATQLNERLTDLKVVLDDSEDKLVTFKLENGLVDVGGSVGRLNEQELLLVTAELAQARSDLSAQSNLSREVRNLAGRPELLESIPAIQADPLVQGTKIDQGQAQRNLDELRNRYGARHPRVVDATSQLQTLNTTLQGHIARVVGSIQNDFQLAQQRVVSMEAELNSGKEEIQSLGSKAFELGELEREVQTNRDIYDTYFNQIAQSKSVDGLSSVNARVSEPAFSPVQPFKPKKQLIIALAALSSMILSMLMAFLYEQMDDTVRSTSDIEDKVGVRLLGILPLVKGGLFSRGRELPLNPLEIPDKNGRFNESINTVRTAVCMGDGKEGRKIITVTSSVPGEGKSTTSINLAYSLSQMERVLLIDCDMRRPTVAKAAGFEKNVSGLSSLIANTAPAKECIKRGAFDGALDILPSGPIPEQPLELLASKRFEKILDSLGEHYDRIIIDSAPTQAVSDALVLGRLSDAVVYCVKSHETSVELIKRGVARLKEVKATLAGVIITQVDIDKITSYGGDYYYQGYYDYYGYTDNGKGGGNKLKLTQKELIDIRSDDSEVDLGLDFSSDAANTSHNDDIFDDFDMTARVDKLTPRKRAAGGSKGDTDMDFL